MTEFAMFLLGFVAGALSVPVALFVWSWRTVSRVEKAKATTPLPSTEVWTKHAAGSTAGYSDWTPN